MLLITGLRYHVGEDDRSLLLGRINHSMRRSDASLREWWKLKIAMCDSMIVNLLELIGLERHVLVI